MPPSRSVEVETVARRALQAAINSDFETLRNLMSADPSLRVLDSDDDEWWKGPAEFFSVRETVVEELPAFDFRINEVEAFEEGGLAWATIFSSLTTPETTTRFRQTAVFRIESGVWRVIQWHNSTPVANQEVIGVELTKTLGDLVTSVLTDDRQLLGTSGAEGTMTLVFTDIVDSTTLAGSLGDEAWADLVAKLESRIAAITAEGHGRVVKFLGDGSMLAFESARSAVRAAVHIQKATTDLRYSLRIGVHTGEVQQTASDIYGLTVNKACGRISGSARTHCRVSPVKTPHASRRLPHRHATGPLIRTGSPGRGVWVREVMGFRFAGFNSRQRVLRCDRDGLDTWTS